MVRFYQLLANNLLANITNFTVWFALTFWIYLETRSVFATGMVAGIYLVLTAATGIWFGSLVDHHRKRTVMLASSAVSFGLYTLAFAAYGLAPDGSLTDPYGAPVWILVALVMLGVIAGNIRSIALPTLVTALIPEDRRDKANGLVGMVTGIGFLTTSVISGLLVAWTGMTGTMVFALALPRDLGFAGCCCAAGRLWRWWGRCHLACHAQSPPCTGAHTCSVAGPGHLAKCGGRGHSSIGHRAARWPAVGGVGEWCRCQQHHPGA